MVANLRFEKQVPTVPAETVYWYLPVDLVGRLDRRVVRAKKANPRGGNQSRSRMLRELIENLDHRHCPLQVWDKDDLQRCALYLPRDFVLSLQRVADLRDCTISGLVGSLLAVAMA